MRESRPPGSVRGVPSNGHPYRDRTRRLYGVIVLTAYGPMPRKAVLSAAQQAALIALPPTKEDLRLHYTLSENDLAIIRRKRGPHNRLGFAVQLCYLRLPGQAMTLEAEPSAEMLAHVAHLVDARESRADAFVHVFSKNDPCNSCSRDSFEIEQQRGGAGWGS